MASQALSPALARLSFEEYLDGRSRAFRLGFALWVFCFFLTVIPWGALALLWALSLNTDKLDLVISFVQWMPGLIVPALDPMIAPYEKWVVEGILGAWLFLFGLPPSLTACFFFLARKKSPVAS